MPDGELKFDGLNLVVRDMSATVAFYRELGVEIPEEDIWRTDSGAHHIEVGLGGEADIGFNSPALATRFNRGYTPNAVEAATLIGFRVATREAVDALYAKLTGSGAKGLQEPYDAFWGARYAIVQDPDGRHVGFMSPVDPEKRSAPPQI